MSVLTLRKRIIYDTHGANIYINICTTKIFIEKVKMTISYQEEIKFISNKIRELRKEKQMTVQELAYRCDMERSNMSRIESGRTNLTVKTMCIICNQGIIQPRMTMNFYLPATGTGHKAATIISYNK